MSAFRQFSAAVEALEPATLKGTVRRIAGDVVEIGGFSGIARIGDLVRIYRRAAGRLTCEVVALGEEIGHTVRSALLGAA